MSKGATPTGSSYLSMVPYAGRGQVPGPAVPPGTKPDQPGGQVATVDGKEVYLPGHTMYELGFRTPSEYSWAQRYGAQYGEHGGKLVPEGAIIRTTRHGTFMYHPSWQGIPGERYKKPPEPTTEAQRVVQLATARPTVKLVPRETKALGFTEKQYAKAADIFKKEYVKQAKRFGIIPTETEAERAARQYFARLQTQTAEVIKAAKSRLTKKGAKTAVSMKEVSEDILKEAFSFGRVYTKTYNRKDIAAEYKAQKAEANKRGMELVETEQEFTSRVLKEQPKLLTLAQDFGIGMVPVWGTMHHWKRMGTGWRIGSIALDALILIPVAGGVSAGVRGAKGLSAAARAKAGFQSLGKIALAEVKAPYTVIRHPVRTVKSALSPIETLLHPKKLPLTSAELAESTVRLRLSRVGLPPRQAMELRDIVTSKAIRGEEAVARLGGTEVSLDKTVLQKTVAPVAVHSAPDIRPFLEGTIVTKGREGGLFVSPNLHTRFTATSAFGEMPKGNVKGALLIRDTKVLSQLKPSGKIYRGTTEIEKVIRPGTELPAPSQILFTRDIGGDRITLLVFGRPMTPTQIARMKLVGSSDMIKQIFMSPAKIKAKGVDYSNFAKLRNEFAEIVEQAKKLRKAGQARNARQLMKRADKIGRRLDDMAEDLRIRYSSRVALRPAGLYFRARPALPRRPVSRLKGDGRRRVEVPRRRAELTRRGEVPARRGEVPRRGEALLRRGGEPRRGEEPRRGGEPRRGDRERPEHRPPSQRRGLPPQRREPARRKEEVPQRREPPRRREALVPRRIVPPRIETPPPRIPTQFRIPGVKLPSEAREKLKSAKGAIAFRMGSLGKDGKKRDVWHVIMHPYKTKEDYLTLVGKRPAEVGIIATGKHSAYRTAQRLFGIPPSRALRIDIGKTDALISRRGKDIAISFKGDPHLTTTGDITVGKKRKAFPLPKT